MFESGLDELRELRPELDSMLSDARAKGTPLVDLLLRLQEVFRRAEGILATLAEGERGRGDLLRELRALGEQTEFNTLLKEVVDSAVNISGAERGLVLFSDGRDGFEFSVARDMNRADVTGAEAEVSHAVARRVIETGRTLSLDDARTDPGFVDSKSVEVLGLRSLLVAPIPLGRRCVGVLYLEDRGKAGAFNAATRGLVEEFGEHIGAALHTARALRDVSRKRDELLSVLVEGQPFPGVVGRSPAFREALSTALKAAPSGLSILILGENGSGKDLMARAVHAASRRSDGPYVALNCASLSAQLMESELFGHVRGAFTGAESDRVGLFASADGGTLFLDEIGDMAPEVQPKLLRALQSGEYRRLGSDRVEHADVRAVAATQRDLAVESREGRFRSDLYYRLNGVTVTVPPLRERREDILLLAEQFLDDAAVETGRDLAFDAPARIALLLYDYPGNIRELENIVRRAAVFSPDGAIGLDSLDEDVAGRALPPAEGLPTGTPRTAEELNRVKEAARRAAAAGVERDFLQAALTRAGGNVSQAARDTGVNRSQLQQMMKAHGMKAADFAPDGERQ